MKPYRHLMQIALMCLLLTFAAGRAVPAASRAPLAKDKCPVCGMFVAKYPEWTATVTFKDSSVLFFDGTKDFFTYYHDMRKYTPSKSKSAISTVSVMDYYSLKRIDARQAFFVNGSDVYGPMGKELVPFERLDDAGVFLKDHKGKTILRFSDVTPPVLKSLE